MLTRYRQIAAKIENVEGTAVALAAADAKILAYEPKSSADYPVFNRTPVKGSLGRLTRLTGIKRMSVGFRVEIRGSGTATTAPAWATILRAAGFQQRSLKKLTIGAITSGPFQHMESISQATSGATGLVVIETATGTTTLYVIPVSGTFNGTNLLTGATSGATSTPSAVADAGLVYTPFSAELSEVNIGAITTGPLQKGELITGGTSGAKGLVYEQTATGAAKVRFYVVSGQFSSGEVITGGTSGATATTSAVSTQSEVPALTVASQEDTVRKVITGARGKCKFSFKDGEPAFVEFELMGVKSSITDIASFSGVAHETTVPPLFMNAALKIGTFSPKFSELDLDMQQVLAERLDANQAGGIISYRITDRDPIANMNPEMELKSTHDFFTNWENNTEQALDFQLGSVTGNMFRFYARKAQYMKIEDADRDGIALAQATLGLNEHVLDDDICILAL